MGEIIGELLGWIFYGIGYVLLRLVGAKKPTERSCTITATVLFLVSLVAAVVYFSRPQQP